MTRVASFGSVNVDRVAPVDAATLRTLRARHDWFPAPGETRPLDEVPTALDAHVAETLLGGKGANQAVAAVAAGADARLHATVGRDADGVALDGAPADADGVTATLAARGVDVAGVATADAPTGTAYVVVGPDGETHIALVGGANDAVDPAFARARADAVAAADALLVQNEVPRAATTALLDALKGRPGRPAVVLDPAPADGAAELVAHPCVDVVTPNEHEAAALADALAAFEGVVVRTRGGDPVAVEAAGDRFEVAPPATDPVDTTGAGDVFAGYLAAALGEADLAGAPGEAESTVGDPAALRPAVRLAATAAALSVEASGVQRATPGRAAVEARLG